MPATYDSIATGSGSGVTFSSIPQGYTDLRLVIVGTTNFELRFNGSALSVYSQTFIEGNGTTGSSTRYTGQSLLYLYNNLVSSITLSTVDIFSYTENINKTCLTTFSDDANGSGWVFNNVGLWRSSGAITSISILNSSPVRASLYGILKA